MTATSHLAPRTSQLSLWCWAVLLAGLALAVKSGGTAPMDHEVSRWVDTLRAPGLDEAARLVTFFGSSSWTLAIITVMGLWWASRRRWAILVAFSGVGAISLLIQVLLRLGVAQWRPDAVLSASMDLVTRYDLAGFPSGHAFRSAFLYGWWAQWLRQRRSPWAAAVSAGCWGLVLLVGATRLSLERHWASDVIGGWLLAALALATIRSLSGLLPTTAP